MQVEVNGTRLWFDVEGPTARPGRCRRCASARRSCSSTAGPGSYDHSYFRPHAAALARERPGRLPGPARARPVGPRRSADVERTRQAPTTSRRSATRSGSSAPIVLGHSRGGFVVALYGARHPGTRGGLVLAGDDGALRPRPPRRRASAATAGDEVAELARRDYGGRQRAPRRSGSASTPRSARRFPTPTRSRGGRRNPAVSEHEHGADARAGHRRRSSAGSTGPTLVIVGERDLGSRRVELLAGDRRGPARRVSGDSR